MTTDKGLAFTRTEDTQAMAMDGFFADEISVARAPTPDDSYETRANWARAAVAQASAQIAEQRSARLNLPDDIRPSHFWEVEFQSALVDPVAYARSMRDASQSAN